jgi:hypothetical protein
MLTRVKQYQPRRVLAGYPNRPLLDERQRRHKSCIHSFSRLSDFRASDLTKKPSVEQLPKEVTFFWSCQPERESRFVINSPGLRAQVPRSLSVRSLP